MSTSSSPSHLPDIALITLYGETNRSFLATVSPVSKTAAFCLLVIVVTVLRSPAALLTLFAGVIGACILAGLPMKNIIRWYTVPAIFVLSVSGLLAFGEPGTPLVSLSPLGIPVILTDAGLMMVLLLLLKALVVVTCSFLVLMTTRYGHIAGLIDRVFPDPLNQIFLLSYRFLFLTLDMTGSLFKALRSRGGGMIHSFRSNARIFGQVFALTFVRSLDRADRVHAAMVARGYRGLYATAEPVPLPSPAGIACLILAGIGTIMLAAMAISHGGFLP